MVAPSRAPLRADRLRAVNVPQPVAVECDAEDRPRTVGDVTVETILESWRIDDEWWREKPVSRQYWRLVLEDGRVVDVYEALAGGRWYRQAY